MIEGFEQKRKERLESDQNKHVDLRLNSQGDLVDVTSEGSLSPDLDDRSSSASSEGQRRTRSVSPSGGCQSGHRGRNRRIPEEERYVTPKAGHYTDAEYDEQALEAWREQCRQSHDYMPDRDYDLDVHGKHLRILQAAIKDFKVAKRKEL
jgi:hypothetical protein